MKHSPIRVIELCAYILIIIAVLAWLLSGGKLYNTPGIPPPISPAIAQPTPAPTTPPVIIPRGEIFPE